MPSGTFVAISAGGSHSLAINPDGTLVGWGRNNYGQTNVPSGTFVAISSGRFHSIAMRTDGTLVGWGDNTFGQTDVPSGTFVAAASGTDFGLAIRTDGTLVGWGENNYGQTNVPSGEFVAVSAGAHHSVAIRTDGTLIGWGDNEYGQTDVPSGEFVAVSGGYLHSIAIRTDGTLVGWGYNAYGQTDVPEGRFAAVAAGWNHSVALGSRELVTCAGAAGVDGDFIVNGAVGIGINTPSYALDVFSSHHVAANLTSESIYGTWLNLDNASDGGTGWKLISTGSGNGEGAGKLLIGVGSDPWGVGRLPMAVTQSGNVGIGTTAPKATLHNAGDYYGRGHLMLHAYEGDGQSGTAYIQARDDSGTSSIAMQLRTKSGGGLVDVMRLNSNGNVGIGTTSPGYLLHCNGTAGKPGGGSWSNSSDARLKKDIQPLHDSLDRLLDLHGVTFEYIDPKSINELPGRRIGMIAQQVEAVFPDWVDLGQNSYKRVTYRGFEALTVEALRELRDEKDAQIEALREQIDAATAENAELRIRLERLEALIRASDGGQTIGPLR